MSKLADTFRRSSVLIETPEYYYFLVELHMWKAYMYN